MSLRRTALSRKAELKRGAALRRTPLARKRALRARSVKAAKAARDTGPSVETRRLVLDRAAGCCELCQRLLHDGQAWLGPHAIHHRRARGMGSTVRPETNYPSNLLLLCGTGNDSGCHGMVESNRAQSYALGWLVRQTDDPATVPVLFPEAVIAGLRLPARVVLLTEDGQYEEVAA